MIKKEHTERGFYTFQMIDTYDTKFDITESSSASVDRIWIQPHATCKIMKSDAVKIGMMVEGEVSGWMEYPLPDEANIFASLHLGKKEAEEIITILQEFVDNSEYDNYYEEENYDD